MNQRTWIVFGITLLLLFGQVEADETAFPQVERTAIQVSAHEPNAIDFPSVEARFVRLTIRAGDVQPCIDELEFYGADKKQNLALASEGSVASASSCLEGYPAHAIGHLNDGQYGNAKSWIAGSIPGWAQIEFSKPVQIERMVFSRDRLKQYSDRGMVDCDISVSMDGQSWTLVRRVTCLGGNHPSGVLLPGELPDSWALRLAHAMPAIYREEAIRIASQAKSEEDLKPLFVLYRKIEEQALIIQKLDREFNPAALRLAVADLTQRFPDTYTPDPDFEAKLIQMEALAAKAKEQLAMTESWTQESADEGYQNATQVIEFARQTLLANPLLDFDELLVLKRKYMGHVRNDVYWQWGQEYGFTVNWSCDFRTKNDPIAPWWDESFEAISLKEPDRPARTIFKAQPTHMLQHPELNWDADKIAFTMPGPSGAFYDGPRDGLGRPVDSADASKKDAAFQVWEMNVNGTGLKQLTTDTEPDIDNGDPCYLPDGRIIFNSTRMFNGVPCEDGQSYIATLCLMNADGSGTRMLCFDQESNWHPSMLNNGRVLFTRYEYADIGHQFGRLLFQMNPDGTGQMEYYGSNSYWPNSIFHARAIPNHPTKVIGVVCGHHGPSKQGQLILFDPARGRNETDGAVQMILHSGKKVERIVADELYAEMWPKFIHPWPLDENYFLVSARLSPEQKEYAVYLVDTFDNMTEICKVPGYSLMEPIPLKKRPRPPMIPDRIVPDAKEATIFLADIYRGPGLKNVPRGKVKQLRVFTYNYFYREMIFRGFGHLATAGADGPWEPRHILGTVPVNEDGSAIFQVPANTPIAVQPLDEQGRALQKMRSWFTAMPGEVMSCVGCHEPLNSTPPLISPQAASRGPATITEWKGTHRGFDFGNEVQPVLDRYCIGCHDGTHADRPDLTRKTAEERAEINQRYHAATQSSILTIFTPSFIALHPYVRRPHAESNLNMQVPAEYYANTSLLVQMLQKGHHNVRLDDDAWDRLYTWIDLDAPDLGSWRNREWGTPQNFYERRLEILKRFGGRADDVESMPKDYLTKPANEIPIFVKPEEEVTVQPVIRPAGWPFDSQEAVKRQKSLGLPERIAIDIPGATKLEFALIPAGTFLMGNPDGSGDERDVKPTTVEKPFYMATTEVTNAQFRALVNKEHHSGFVGWQSIDWRSEGHPLDGEDQPVIRVSWCEANKLCQKLGKLSGKQVFLPSEVEWEWAARAGSDTPLWYGTYDTDFSPFENLAGHEREYFAFGGKRRWYLRDDRFEDPFLVTAPVGSFKANPWGLHDMAGNVSEWTRSVYEPRDFASKPAENETEHVVRGGSWSSRPRDARTSYRWKYPVWQKVENVGIRPIIAISED